MGDAGLWVVVEGAIVATGWGGTKHAHDGAAVDAVEKVGVVGREVNVEPLYVHADEDAAAGTHPLGAYDGAPLLLGACDEEEGLRLHLHQRHGWGGAERPPAAGKHRRARGILDGEARDDVAEEHIWKEAEAVEVDDVVERGG